MRTLKFIVEGNTLVQDPSCSFDGLFPAPNQKIRAEFSFSEEWISAPKVAGFYSMLNNEFPAQIIDEKNCCTIPSEALLLPVFKIQILGTNRGKLITTNTLTVYQRGGNK